MNHLMIYCVLLQDLFEKKVHSVQADDPINFMQLLAKADSGSTEVSNNT